LSDKYFGNKLFANVILLGVAYQQGLLPLKIENLIWAIEHTMGPAARENVRAFQLGRKVVLDPQAFSESKNPIRYKNLVDFKADYFARSHPAGKRAATAYRHLMEHAEKTVNLPEPDFCDLAVRISDMIWFENAAYAKRYLDLVKIVFSRDTAEHQFAATRAAIWNLAKVMLIKDEVYVAHLLTSQEKLARDRERYDVDESRGDRIHYRHINRPRFDIGGFKIEFDIRTRNWQLNIMKRMKFLRRFLPNWHRSEKDFRDWYAGLLLRFQYVSPAEYRMWLEILKCPQSVRGYRHIRQPKQEVARKTAAAILARFGRPVPTSQTPQSHPQIS
jgi:indolepyruvate ferredoxin oxidoreductase